MEIGVENHSRPEIQKIQTQCFGSDEELQVINASPSESGVGDEQPFLWPSIVGAVFGAGAGPAVPDSPAISPGGMVSSQPATNIHELVDKSGEKTNFERLNKNPSDEPIPRPPMNGRAATRDSEIGNEKFTTARSSLEIRSSVTT